MPTVYRVAITAAGVASPLGLGLVDTLTSLRAGRDCVSAVTSFDVSQTRAKTAGQMDCSQLLENLTRQERRLHPASHLLIAAAREAQQGDRHFIPELLIVGTTSGGMSFGEDYYRTQLGHPGQRSHRSHRARWLANYLPQKAVHDAQETCGFTAPTQIIANACASGTNAIGHAFALIRAGKQRRIFCGGYDAISEMVFVGFDSLQASTAEKIRPFDRDRSGLVLGEGAAMLALEEMESALQRGARILGEVTGYGISTDNHHLTQPHPSGIGPLQAMERALASAERQPREVDYVNAHGTATAFNDATEGTAIAQLFGAKGVPVSSTKSMMGHSLGAAGAIEAVFSLLALQHGFLPPNINYAQADPAWDLDIVANHSREARVRCVVSNSFGFGGTNASIVLEKAREN